MYTQRLRFVQTEHLTFAGGLILQDVKAGIKAHPHEIRDRAMRLPLLNQFLHIAIRREAGRIGKFLM